MARTDFRRLERIAPIVTVAPEGGGAPVVVDVDAEGRRRRYEAERRRRAEAAAARTVTAPGLGEIVIPGDGLPPSQAVPSTLGSEIVAPMEAADALAASERRAIEDERIRREMLADPVLRGRATEDVEIPGLGIRYNPVALSLAVPGAAQGAALVGEIGERLGLTPDRRYADREAEIQAMLDLAEYDDPGSAMVGRLAGAVASAPLFELGAAGEAIAAARGLGGRLLALGEHVAPYAVGGGVLGAGAGYMASEGEDTGTRLGEAMRGGYRGALAGGALAGLGSLGAAGRAVGLARPGVRGLAEMAGGGALEGSAYGGLARAMESPSRVSSDAYLGDVLTPGLADPLLGAGVAGLSRTLGRATRSAAADRPRHVLTGGEGEASAVLGLEDDALAAAEELGYTRPERPGFSWRDVAEPLSLAESADEARLRAGGILDRRQMRQAGRAFGSTEAAAEAMRESGISAPGSYRSVRANAEYAAEVRDRAGAALSRIYDESERLGGAVPGNVIADRIEDYAARMVTESSDPTTLGVARYLRDRADDLRYGVAGTARREAVEGLRAMEITPGEDIGLRELTEAEQRTLPGIVSGGPERIAPTVERAIAPRVLGTREVVRNLQNLAANTSDIRNPGVATPSLSARARRAEYAALADARGEALRRSVPQLLEDYERASRDFRIASVVAPPNAPATADITAPGRLRAGMGASAGAAAGGVIGGAPGAAVGGVAGWALGHGLSQVEDSIRAGLAERAAGRESFNLADALTLAASHARVTGLRGDAVATVERAAASPGSVSLGEQAAALATVHAAMPPGAVRDAIGGTLRRARAAAVLSEPGIGAAGMVAGAPDVPESLAMGEDQAAAEAEQRADEEFIRRREAERAAERRRRYGLAVPESAPAPEALAPEDAADAEFIRRAEQERNAARRRRYGLEVIP